MWKHITFDVCEIGIALDCATSRDAARTLKSMTDESCYVEADQGHFEWCVIPMGWLTFAGGGALELGNHTQMIRGQRLDLWWWNIEGFQLDTDTLIR